MSNILSEAQDKQLCVGMVKWAGIMIIPAASSFRTLCTVLSTHVRLSSTQLTGLNTTGSSSTKMTTAHYGRYSRGLHVNNCKAMIMYTDANIQQVD